MDLSWLDIFWISQLIIVASSYVLGLSQGAAESKDHRQVGAKLAFYQFNKRIYTYYFFGLVWTAWVAGATVSSYILGKEPGENMVWLIYTLIPIKRKLVVEPTCVILALGLLEVHLIRRLYESMKISIFSRRQALNVVDLLLSFSFYAAAALSVIADGPELKYQEVSIADLGVRHLVALPLYIWASVHQHQSNKIFAKLRRNRFGHIVTTNYGKPKGDWFEWVSCPHYLAEVLVYISIALVLGVNGTTWWFLCAYLVTQQVFTAFNIHAWYKKKFEDYPTDRRAIFPFLL